MIWRDWGVIIRDYILYNSVYPPWGGQEVSGGGGEVLCLKMISQIRIRFSINGH